jgi:Ca-activated chloride channel family protein
LRTLGPGDRYAIEVFDNVNEWFEGERVLVAADEDALARGERWLRGIGARGGTEVDAALADALALLEARADASGRQAAIVLVTDGQVGNEGAVLKRLGQARGEVRLFVVGVDTAVNAAFLDQLARAGRGTAALVEPGAPLEGALVSIGRDIGRALVTDLSLEGVGGTVIEAESVAPSRVPDLFGGRATMVAFRASAPGAVRVRGKSADGSPFEVVVAPRAVTLPAVAHLWARERLADLEDAYRLEPQRADAIRSRIVDTSIAHRVLTRFTAFVAVDEREVVANPRERRKVVQPVEMPASWDAEAIGATYRSSAMPFAAGVTLGAPRATRWLRTAPEAAMAKLGDTLGRLTSPPEPPDEATSLAGDLPTLLDDLKRAFGQAVPWTTADTERVRSLRKRLAPLEHTLAGEAREWVQRLVSLLNRIIHLLEQRSGHDDALQEALDALGRLTRDTPVAWSRKRRFWERSV